MEVFLFFFFYSKWRAWHGVIGRGVGRVVAAPAQRNGVQRGWMPNVQGGVLRFALLIFSKWEVVALSPINALLDFWQDFFFFCGFLTFPPLAGSIRRHSLIAGWAWGCYQLHPAGSEEIWLAFGGKLRKKKRYTFFWRESTSSFPSGYQTSPAVYCI